MRLSTSELRLLRSLSQKKVRQAEGKFLLEGWRALKDALNASARIELAAVLGPYLRDPDYGKLIAELERRRIPIRELNEAELRKTTETVHSQGIVAVVQQRRYLVEELRLERASLIVAVDAVSDPGNVGSMIRSADWFRADAVLLGKGCVELYNEKVVRSTVGSIFHVPVVESVDLRATLPDMKSKGLTVAALSADAKKSYDELTYDGRYVFVFGSEAHGVRRELRASADVELRIPKFGRAESLNVGVACGIVLANVRSRQQRHSMD